LNLEIKIPSIKTFFEKKKFSISLVNSMFKKIHEKKEERIDLMVGETQSKNIYLVIQEGEPIGQFYIENKSFKSITGRDYFNLLQTLPDSFLSYYTIDPVFAKCLLIPSQNKPVYKGAVIEKDLKKKIETIQNDQGENMIFLKENNEVNFFYFKYGRGVESYFHKEDKRPAENAVGDQFLVYVLGRDVSLLTMEVYHNPKTAPLLNPPLTKEAIAEGVVEFFQKQKHEPTPAHALDFEPDHAAPPPSSPPEKEEAGAATQPPKGKWYFELVGGEQMGRRTGLKKNQLTIGRMKTDIMLSDAKISRQHAVIEWTEQGCRFTDLGSTNGSFINGQPVKTQILKPGDIIRLGGTLIKVIVE
jgi:hypothetical protein